jgi:DNA-binding LacI/PurR family transcriptional regulator
MIMKDVAKIAGVSVATVSNVLTGKKPVSDELKKRVLEVIKEFDYKVDLVARGLKSKQSFNIGIVMPEITKLFFPDLLTGIEDAAKEFGYTLTYYSTRYDFDMEKQYVKQLQSGWSDGVLIDSCCPLEKQHEWAKELSEMSNSKMKMPVVCVDRILDEDILSSVCVDNEKNAHDAVTKLINIGRKRILHISAPLNISIGALRYDGYKRALKEEDINFIDKYVLKGDYSAKKAYMLMKDALKDNLTFDGIFAANDQTAIGALKALKEKGVRVPDKVAIIGFDNSFPGTLVEPSLSTYNVPKYKMGYEAFRLLLNRMDNLQAPIQNLVLEADFIERQSTNINAVGGWDLTRW